jgi:hypothetical protein
VTLRTRDSVRSYVAEIEARVAGGPTARRGWLIARHGVLAVGLAIATLQYYFMDVYVQIASLPSITLLAVAPRAAG